MSVQYCWYSVYLILEIVGNGHGDTISNLKEAVDISHNVDIIGKNNAYNYSSSTYG